MQRTIAFSAVRGGDAALPKLLRWDLLNKFGLDSRSYRLLYWNLKVFLRYKLPDHSIVFARWRQQQKNGRVTLGFATHFANFAFFNKIRCFMFT